MLLQSQQEMQTFVSQQIMTLRNAVPVVPGEDDQQHAVTDDGNGNAIFADGMDDKVGEQVGGPRS